MLRIYVKQKYQASVLRIYVKQKYQASVLSNYIRHGVWGHYILNNYIIYAIPFTQFNKRYLRYTYIIVVIMP